jgi:HK97 family phage prohead protease
MKLLVVHQRESKRLLIVRQREAQIPLSSAAPDAPKAAATDEFARIKRFDAGLTLEIADDKKPTAANLADGRADFRDVVIRGYLSTFKNVTESDRDGDYVEPGAFAETIPNFMKNPVILRDHMNMTSYAVGQFKTVREDNRGLFVEGLLSNADDARDLRVKVVEGVIRTMSMGGIFHYKEDGRGIFKVSLWEGSFTPIPANPDALVSVRSLSDEEKKFVKSGGIMPTPAQLLHFLHVHGAQNRMGVAA